ncbi:MAG: hypothetical protein C5B52_09555 [Bacteroidetes bacterium]|nr:MAG: hypothetical protein C5B52_09555 [Bacteroidota bacterium]
MSVLVAIYNPAEFYPPTINAVESLARNYEKVTLITHDVEGLDPWEFPKNVRVEYVDKWNPGDGSQNFIRHIQRFLKFSKQIKKALVSEKFKIVLLYEPHAVLSYKMSGLHQQKKPDILWYHSHDIYVPEGQRTFSVGWWAGRAEQKIFKELDIFTLPAEERKEFFPLQNLKGKYFFLPNYPSKYFYKKFYGPRQPGNEFRIIYQGRIAPGHGLEEIISLLRETPSGKKLSLHLKGLVDEEYKSSLIRIAGENNCLDDLHFYAITSYKEVPALGSTCHIGIAIHTRMDIMNKTLGTSSNKIYEYAALGLPVLLFDNPHFRKHLEKYSWTAFTDCSRDSLLACINRIISNYNKYSEDAHRDFEQDLNFENNFSKVLAQIP